VVLYKATPVSSQEVSIPKTIIFSLGRARIAIQLIFRDFSSIYELNKYDYSPPTRKRTI